MLAEIADLKAEWEHRLARETETLQSEHADALKALDAASTAKENAAQQLLESSASKAKADMKVIYHSQLV